MRLLPLGSTRNIHSFTSKHGRIEDQHAFYQLIDNIKFTSMRSSNVQSLQMKLVNNCCIVGFSKITQAKNFGEKHIVSGDKKRHEI